MMHYGGRLIYSVITVKEEKMTVNNYDRKIWELEDKELVTLLIGRDGGKTTVKIIDMILTRPFNANKLATSLNLDYKTIKHHIKLLLEHKYVEEMEIGKTTIYYPSEKLFNNLDEYNIITEHLKNN